MAYYPIFMELIGKRCLVVGGGVVAERKVRGLIKAGAKVTVLSPRLTEGLTKLKRGRKIKHIAQSFAAHLKDTKNKDSISDFTLVITATSSPETNKGVFDLATKANIPINTVDDPTLCTFIVPAVVDRGPMQVAISTSGRSPLLAKRMKELLDDTLPRELAVYTELMGAVRAKLMAAEVGPKALKRLKKGVKSAKKNRLLDAVLSAPILGWIRTGERAKIEAALKKLLGPGYTLKALGVKIQTKR